jgi:hypothetical protein
MLLAARDHQPGESIPQRSGNGYRRLQLARLMDPPVFERFFRQGVRTQPYLSPRCQFRSLDPISAAAQRCVVESVHREAYAVERLLIFCGTCPCDLSLPMQS